MYDQLMTITIERSTATGEWVAAADTGDYSRERTRFLALAGLANALERSTAVKDKSVCAKAADPVSMLEEMVNASTVKANGLCPYCNWGMSGRLNLITHTVSCVWARASDFLSKRSTA